MNREGVFVGAVNRRASQDVGADFSYREYFSYLATHPDQDTYYSPAFTETETGEIWLAASRTLRRQDRPFSGVIFAGLSGRFLSEELGNIHFAEGGSIALLDRSKQLLFRTPPVVEMLGRAVEDLNLDEFLSSEADSYTYIGVSPLDNRRKIITFQQVPGAPYLFAVASNTDSALAGWRTKMRVYVGGWLFSAVVMFLIARAYSKIHIVNDSLEQRNRELQKAINEIHTLQGIIPICAGCKKIKNEKGYWERVESYISNHSQALFSHGLCPECFEKEMGKLSENANAAGQEGGISG